MNESNIVYKDLGLYIHIPFCAKKCDYCDFLSAPATEETIKRYFEAMLVEIEQYAGGSEGYIVPTIFFGGGTPSLVDADYIEQIMVAINRIFHIDRERLEVTIEINPGTVDEEKFKNYHRIGINRLSFGLQSTNTEELSLLGRIHSYEQFEENYILAREIGFSNINIDLMSAIPGQTVASWEKTLKKVIGLNPEHISAYSLIIEEGTKFYERYQEGTKEYINLPDEETDRLIYHKTKEILQNNGYYRYEISNYAKNAYECQHNSSYWIGTDYLGIGLGASSLLDGARYSNMHDIEQYIKLCNLYKKNLESTCNIDKIQKLQQGGLEDLIGLRINQERLTELQRMEEFMFLGLRMSTGISKESFVLRFGVDVDSVYKDVIKRMVESKLMEIDGNMIRLTDFGMDVSNYVFTGFLLNS